MKLTKRERQIKIEVQDLLRQRGLLHSTDDLMLNEFLFCLRVIKQAQDDINEQGVSVNVIRDPEKAPLYQRNPSVNVYADYTKLLIRLSEKIGISPADRKKIFDQVEAPNNDGFDEDE